MSEKNKKVLSTFMWGIGLLLVITCMLLLNNSDKSDKSKNESKNQNVIVYDGSENNPHIEGVQ